jgi:uncharacterized protein YndB with AHSA1/START domain
MNPPSHVSARVTHHFGASPERVFDAWLDARTAGRWLFATPGGQMVRVEIDARVGGWFCLVDRRNGDDVSHIGRYLEIERPRRLVFNFTAEPQAPDHDRVTVDIAPMQAGCRLTLTHDVRAAWADYLPRIERGWAEIVDGLAEMLGR